MKLVLTVLLALAAIASSSFAAAPVVTSVRVDSIVSGESAVLEARVGDTDSDLDYLRFEVTGPGVSGWVAVGDVLVSGSDSAAELLWTPPAVGSYTVKVTAYDLNSSATKQSTFEVFSGRRIIRDVTISAGVIRMFTESGEIQTAETSTVSNVVDESGGNLIFWAGGRVTLKPGFHAKSGSFFWAAVDHDMDGYSDIEEITDTDGDGMFDAWEVEHGLNMINAADAGADNDGDGLTNLQEFQQGLDVTKRDNPNVRLVVFTPNF